MRYRPERLGDRPQPLPQLPTCSRPRHTVFETHRQGDMPKYRPVAALAIVYGMDEFVGRCSRIITESSSVGATNISFTPIEEAVHAPASG